MKSQCLVIADGFMGHEKVIHAHDIKTRTLMSNTLSLKSRKPLINYRPSSHTEHFSVNSVTDDSAVRVMMDEVVAYHGHNTETVYVCMKSYASTQ